MATPQTTRESEFDRFWKSYPRRVAKMEARKAWARLNPSPDLVAAMLAALDWQRESDQWTKDDGRYIPHAASWIRGERWEDEQPAPVPLRGRTVTDKNLRGLLDDLAVLDDHRRTSTARGVDAVSGGDERTPARDERESGRLLPHLPRRAG